MAEPRDSWRDLIRQTMDYFEILHQGGFRYAEGKFEHISAEATSRSPLKRIAGQSKPASSAISAETRGILKAALSDPYAHLAGPERKPMPMPATSSSPRTPQRQTAAATPAKGSLPPISGSQAPPISGRATAGKGKTVTLRDRAEGVKVIATADDLERLRYLVSGCHMCGLATGRTLAVPGEGNPHAELMFIGEGPGYHEDVQGKPFVGRAGALLTQMIQAMDLQREDVYITNIVKCRPPGNRDPEPDEIKACEPYLRRQIELIRPKLICALGRIAIQGLLRNTTPISKLRGTWQTYQKIPLMPTFHPAFLLRDPSQKRLAWEDLKAIMARMAELK